MTDLNRKNKSYVLSGKPSLIPVPGDKIIEEYIGRVNTQTESVSVARMEAPVNWGEPAQKPTFDEITIVLEGAMQVEVGGETLKVSAGETILVKAGETVRYSNPFKEKATYWAICIPAFSIKNVNRKSEEK